MDNRNPYLLLGVDYGTDPDRARRSFARAARRVRRASTSAITVEDLNWALHQIQTQEADPFDSVMVFRVPANPAVFDPEGTGLFGPEPRPLARRTTTDATVTDTVAHGLADDISALLSAVLPRLVQFDYGYETPEGDHV